MSLIETHLCPPHFLSDHPNTSDNSVIIFPLSVVMIGLKGTLNVSFLFKRVNDEVFK